MVIVLGLVAVNLAEEAKAPASAPATAPATQPAASQPATQPDPTAEANAKALVALLNDQAALPDRQAAAKQLLTTKAFTQLKTILEGGSPAARTVVCDVAAAAPPPELIDPFLAQLGADDAGLSAAVNKVLSSYKDNGVSGKLSAVARDANQPMVKRQSAVKVLGLMGENPVALNALVSIIGDTNTDPAIREAGRLALRGEEYTTLLESHLALLNESLSKLDAAGQAALHLKNLSSPIKEVQLLSLKWAQEQKAANKLPHESPIVAGAAGLLTDGDAEVRMKALDLLSTFLVAADAKAILAAYPHETDVAVRQKMLGVLGALGNPEAISVAVAALKDPNETVAIAAAAALGRLAANLPAAVAAKRITPEAAKALGAALLEYGQAPDKGGRHLEAFSAMASVADPSFGPVFAGQLGSGDVKVRRSAAVGIKNVGDVAHLVPLRARLEAEPDASLRIDMVQTIGAIGRHDDDLNALFSRTSAETEKDEKVQAAAAAALLVAIEPRLSKDIQAWAKKFDPKTDTHLALLRKAEEKLAKANGTPLEIATLRSEIGDALSARGKAPEAAPFYVKALDHLAMVASPDPAGSVAQTQKLLPIVLAGLAPDKGAEIVAKYKTSPVEGVAGAVAEVATKYAENLSEGGDPVAALQWIDALVGKVPDKFAGPYPARIDAARARAVVKNNTQKLQSDKDKTEATKTILALGPLAVKPLAEQLKTIVSAEKPNAALEKEIWALLAQLSPAALKDKPIENKDQKLAAVDGLLNGE